MNKQNAWNIKFDDDNIKSVDFDREVTLFEKVNNANETIESESYESTSNSQSEQILYNYAFITKSEDDNLKAKLTELNNWKDQPVYIEEDDHGLSCISVRWVISKKMVKKTNDTWVLFSIIARDTI